VAQAGLGVNGIGSTPYNVVTGGTDFNINAANYQSTYWNTSNNSTTGDSAKSYVPETSWNDSCAQTALSNCTTVSQTSPTINIIGGGGGQSTIYPKPSWQAGTGVPSGNFRYLPDISFFSADGFVSGSFYIVCQSDLDLNGAACDVNGPIPFVDFEGVGGTSAAAPTFAGVMSLVNQKTGSRQGIANYELYGLAATHPAVFNDVIVGNNSVPCTGGVTADCTGASTIGVLEIPNSNDTALTGTLSYLTGAGYDLATGLGSVNVGNLLANWPTTASFTPTSTTIVTLMPTTINHGASVTVHVTVTPAPPNNTTTNPEAVSLIGTCLAANPNCFGSSLSSTSGVDRFTSNNYTISNVDFWQLTNGSVSSQTSALMGCIPASGQTTCSYNITAHYPGDGTLGASDSAPVLVTVNPENSTVTVTAVNIDLFTGNATTAVSEPYGSFNLIRADVVGTASGDESATGTVTFSDSSPGCPASICGTFPLNPEGYAEAQTPNISIPGNLSPPGISVLPALSVGAHHFSASYSGDGSYKAQTSNTATFTITQATTAVSILQPPTPTTATSGVNFGITAFVDTNSIGNAPTGTVTFFNGATQIGAPAPLTPTTDANGFVAATATITTSLTATGTITAIYNGDANYTASVKSAPVTVTVQGPDFSVSGVTPVTITTLGQPGTSVISVTAGAGFSGTVTLTCGVMPNTVNDPPGCSFTAPSVAVANPAVANMPITATSTVTMTTTPASRLVRPVGPPSTPIQRIPVLAVGVAFALALMLLLVPARRRRGTAVFGVILFAVAIAAASCGGGGGGGGGNSNPGTQTGPYQVTVTATSGSLTHTTVVTLSVQ
jgi:hypothetical protein